MIMNKYIPPPDWRESILEVHSTLATEMWDVIMEMLEDAHEEGFEKGYEARREDEYDG